MEKGALSVRAICTHAILSGGAYEKIENSQLLELIVTDSIPLKRQSDKISIVVLLSCRCYAHGTITIPLVESL
jgi:ribose-phosphate pyrophosphokinase